MKHFDAFRQKRNEVYQHLFTGRELCIAGLLMMPAFLFNPSTPARMIQFFLFWFFAWLAGKKNNPLITLLIMLGIILFNLLVPYGEELFRLGRFRITEGSLWGGIHRAVTLEGLIMLSKVCIRQDVKLPGTFGSLIGESFRMLERINERKSMINRKNVIGGIDQMMIELSAGDESFPSEGTCSAEKSSAAGIVLLLFVCFLMWSITLVSSFAL